METAGIQRVYLFDGKNFSNWSFRMEAYLEELGLLHCIQRTLEEEAFFPTMEPPAGEAEAAAMAREAAEAVREAKRKQRRQEDAKCRSVMIHKIADSQLEYIRGKATPKAIWDALKNHFDQKGVSGVFFLLLKLTTTKYDEKLSLEEHILAFEKVVRELESANIKFNEPVLVFFLLYSMPKSYAQLITVLETLPVEQCSMEFVKSRLLNEDVKRQHGVVKTETATAFASGSGKFQFKCHGCGKPGHKRVDCTEEPEKSGKSPSEKKKKQKGKAQFAETDDDVALVTVVEQALSAGEGKFRWVLDSGASEHMVGDKSYLVNVRRLETPVRINVAKSGVSLLSHYAGEVKLTAFVDDEEINCTVHDVLYVPGLLRNLFSVKKVTERGTEVIFSQQHARILKNKKAVVVATRKDRLYELNVQLRNEGSAMVVETESKQSLWHRRYGHIGNTGLLKLIRGEMVEGLEVGVKSASGKEICESCVMGKQARLPFDESSKPRSSRPLELVHTDVCGPMTNTAWNGRKYFVSFIDDYTHFTVVHILEAKSDVMEAFRKYAAMATAHFGSKIARLRSDNGGEYMNAEFKEYCDEAGIVMEPTVPYTPQQNGVAERMNRTVAERARAMLDDAELKRYMWPEAVYTAVYLINRSPTAALREAKTPYEMWFGHKPDVSKLRVFGSKAFVHIPKEKRSKLDPKSHVCFLVGYGMNGYRLWDPEQRKVIVARDVIVDEKKKRSEKYSDDHLVSDSLGQSEEQNELQNKVPDNAEVLDSDDESDWDDGAIPVDEVPEQSVREESVPLRRSERMPKRPARFDQYVVSPYPKRHANLTEAGDDCYIAFALNAESYVDELPEDIEDLKKRDDWPLWKAAVDDEMRSLEKNRTWTLVDPPTGRRIVPCKWVFKIKKNADGTPARYKARLVAKGCSQRAGYDYQETYAPVVRMSTVRTLLAVAVQQDLHLHQMDVRTAFLNGNLDETVYIRQPPGFERGNQVCRLNKSLYGLKQAPRSWNERFNKYILKLGFQRSPYDSCLYTHVSRNHKLYLVLYVDDILIAANSMTKMEWIKAQLANEFEMEDLKDVSTFLGLKINRNRKEGTLAINQSGYVSSLLERFGMKSCNPAATPLEANLKLTRNQEGEQPTQHPYRELIGCLTYLMLSSRPDISFAVNYLSRFQSGATDTHWTYLKRVLRYLQGTKDFSLVYTRRQPEGDPLTGFADADWGNDVDNRHSTSGYTFQVFGNTVTWTSRKQTTVSLSSTEAEYVSLSQAACEAIWMKNLLSEFGVVLESPLTIHEDNQSCIHIAEEPRDQKRMKHLDIRYNFIRECIQDKVIKLQYIATANQLADVFTKGLPAGPLKQHRTSLGLRGGVGIQP